MEVETVIPHTDYSGSNEDIRYRPRKMNNSNKKVVNKKIGYFLFKVVQKYTYFSYRILYNVPALI